MTPRLIPDYDRLWCGPDPFEREEDADWEDVDDDEELESWLDDETE